MGLVLLLSIFLTMFVQVAPQQPPATTPAAGNPTVVVSTSLGDITIELFKDRAPVSVANFLQYVKDDHYPGTVFHRVVSGYVVQGGGYDTSMTEKPTRAPILNEATNGLRNLTGTVAMARTRALRSGEPGLSRGGLTRLSNLADAEGGLVNRWCWRVSSARRRAVRGTLSVWR